jgi:outer membrane protein TolC
MTPPDPPFVPDSPAQWLAGAEENYPDFQKLRHQSESYSLSAAAMKRMQWPMLDVSGSYGIRSGYKMGGDGMPEKRDNMVSFSVTLSLPLFEGHQQGQAARSMDAMKMASLGEARQLQRDVNAKLVTLHERAKRLSLSLALYRDRILPTTEDAYRTALSGYASNRTDFIALLTYATAVYRDRVTVNELANALAQTLIEAERYTTNTGELPMKSSSSTK